MPRPRKHRRVCFLPQCDMYGPVNGPIKHKDVITMSVSEYETIRIIDFEQMTQEECAKSMDVARTTVQKMYSDARQKIADSFVNGKAIKIEGGDYMLCNGKGRGRAQGCGGCRRRGNRS